jgi:hypothetical protein
MKHVKWKFKTKDVYFVSREDRITWDVQAKARMLGLPANSKIEIQNDYFTLSESTSTGCASCNSNTSTPPLATVPVDNKKVKAKPEATELFDLYGDVEPTAPAADVLEDDIDLELLGGTSNRMAL